MIEGEGPALVLQHGFTESVVDWYEAGYIEALKPNYRLILIDARGHGSSDKPHDPDAYVLNRRWRMLSQCWMLWTSQRPFFGVTRWAGGSKASGVDTAHFPRIGPASPVRRATCNLAGVA